MKNKVTYDDTRDIAIRIVEYLIDNKYITENENEWDFHLQDAIQDEINEVLGLDIDEKFEITIK
tara:strand:+ start:845 stop:1036 length:192 start_codon:yes stop_codon:yes gene_type:complete